jgi:hypothetical protein
MRSPAVGGPAMHAIQFGLAQCFRQSPRTKTGSPQSGTVQVGPVGALCGRSLVAVLVLVLVAIIMG